jgi:hypothetical protein
VTSLAKELKRWRIQESMEIFYHYTNTHLEDIGVDGDK